MKTETETAFKIVCQSINELLMDDDFERQDDVWSQVVAEVRDRVGLDLGNLLKPAGKRTDAFITFQVAIDVNDLIVSTDDWDDEDIAKHLGYSGSSALTNALQEAADGVLSDHEDCDVTLEDAGER